MKDTSTEAYIANIKEGKTSLQAVQVFNCIRNNPPLTRLEISEKTGIPINAVCGRVNELLHAHLIVEGDKKLQRTGRQAYTLKAVA